MACPKLSSGINCSSCFATDSLPLIQQLIHPDKMQIRVPCSHIKQHVVKSHARKNPIMKNGVLRNRQLFAFGLEGTQHFYSDFLIAILAFSHKTMPSFVIGSNQINLRAVSPPSPQSRHRKRQLPGKAESCQVLTTDLLKRFRCEIRKTRLYGRFPF